MKLIRSVALLCLTFILCTGLALAQDLFERDTVRFASTALSPVEWSIDSEADSISPAIELWAFSDFQVSNPLTLTDTILTGASLGFQVKVDAAGWDEDRWDLDSAAYPWKVIGNDTLFYHRTWSSVDSFLSVDNFVWDPGVPALVKTVQKSKLSVSTGLRYNGLLLGLADFAGNPCLPDSTPIKLGELFLKMNLSERDYIMPDTFDIVIDSAFFPPGGSFKFSYRGTGLVGFAPVFTKGVVRVTSHSPMDADGSEPLGQVPISYELSQNYPNPFNPATTIKFSLEKRGSVDLSVYNILGRKVKTLANTEMDAGPHDVLWDGTDDSGDMAASGVYFYKLEAGNFVKTKKMLMLK
jgi:hypothetical protein